MASYDKATLIPQHPLLGFRLMHWLPSENTFVSTLRDTANSQNHHFPETFLSAENYTHTHAHASFSEEREQKNKEIRKKKERKETPSNIHLL